MTDWPISVADVARARARIAPYLAPTPLRHYPELDAAAGGDARILVKHENHQPTNAFKVRNALSAVTALAPAERARGVIAATRGNHGQGVAYAARLIGVPAVICVPEGNSPEKNAAIRGFGAELVIGGRDYDESVQVARRLIAERGLTEVHSTNNRDVIAGAGTITLEIMEQLDAVGGCLDAMVVAVGGGSQIVGAMAVARALRPGVEIFGVQAARASAIHDSWHAGERRTVASADTFADGLATRATYDLTWPAIREGVTDFVTVDESELAGAVRTLLATTHNLAEGAGAAGLAGLRKLGDRLAGKTVAVILSGANIDLPVLRRVLNGEI